MIINFQFYLAKHITIDRACVCVCSFVCSCLLHISVKVSIAFTSYYNGAQSHLASQLVIRNTAGSWFASFLRHFRNGNYLWLRMQFGCLLALVSHAFSGFFVEFLRCSAIFLCVCLCVFALQHFCVRSLATRKRPKNCWIFSFLRCHRLYVCVCVSSAECFALFLLFSNTPDNERKYEAIPKNVQMVSDQREYTYGKWREGGFVRTVGQS